MTHWQRSLLTSAALFGFIAFSGAALADELTLKPLGNTIRIAIIGDSTAATYAKAPAGKAMTVGWGQVFGEYFNDRVTVLNHAASGRSSKSFRVEKRWEPVLKEKPDFVFIQFGHNDQKGKGPERETDPETTYAENLIRYVTEARTAGIRPVLVTPVARRTFENGRLVTTLTPYADATKRVAQELKVPVVDLHGASFALYEKLGNEGSSDLNPVVTDCTHFSRKGALAIAGLVTEQLPPELKPALK